MAQVYRFGSVGTLREIVLPQLAPYLLAAARKVSRWSGRSCSWWNSRPFQRVGFQLQTIFSFSSAARVAYSAAFVVCVLMVEAS